jgi:hypothetical protein
MQLMNRRYFLLGTVSTIALGAAAAAKPLFMRGGSPVGGGGGSVAGRSMTIYNTAGTTSPANTPIHLVMTFVSGEVPAGSIAVPQEGGVDVPYQADVGGRTYGDGSLYIVDFYMVRPSGIAGNGSVQITFDVRAGSYSNTSSITTADIVAERDFQIALSNTHTAVAGSLSQGIGSLSTMAITLNGSGGVGGGKALYPSNLTIGTAPVVGGGGTGGQISVSGGVVTVVSPGTGYGFVGSGAFTRKFNDIVSTVNATGNRVNGVEIVQYAKGRFVDAWRARSLVSGLNHYHATICVERWKKPDGTLLQYRRYAVCGTGLVDLATNLTNYTYDFDFKDGTTVIVGANGGDARFQSILNYVGGSFGTFDDDAEAYWESNHTALTAIIPLRNPTEARYFKKSKIALPWLELTPDTPVPTTPAYYELTPNGGLNIVSRYRPFGNAGIRSPMGAASTGSEENPMNALDGLLWEAQLNGNLSDALVWRNNIKVAAAHALGFPQLGSGFFEKTTMFPANVLPTSYHTFTGMTPTREATTGTAQSYSGFSHPLIGGSTLTDPVGAAASTYHHVGVIFGTAMVVGDQWMIDALENGATTQLWWRNPTYVRQATLGATIYYGVYGGQTNNRRVQAWAMRAQSQAVRAMRATWADGSANVVRSYLDYATQSHYNYLMDLVPFTGTVSIGAGGGSSSKTVDYTGTGAYPEAFTTPTFGGGSDFINPFMDYYDMMVCAQIYAHHKGTALGTAVLNYINHRKIYWARQYQGTNTPLYGKLGYYVTNYDHVQPNPQVADTSWGPLDVSNPRFGLAPEGVIYNSVVGMGFTNGSAEIWLPSWNGSAYVDSGGIRWYPSTVIGNGSRVRLTNLTNEGGAGIPPSVFNLSTWYYWLQDVGDPSHVRLCTGLIGGNPALPDPATAVVANSTPTDYVSFWIVPINAVPGNNIRGWYNNPGGDGSSESRPATALGGMRILKAAGIVSDTVDLDSAIANLLAVMTTDGGNYSSSAFGTTMQYGFDETYG